MGNVFSPGQGGRGKGRKIFQSGRGGTDLSFRIRAIAARGRPESKNIGKIYRPRPRSGIDRFAEESVGGKFPSGPGDQPHDPCPVAPGIQTLAGAEKEPGTQGRPICERWNGIFEIPYSTPAATNNALPAGLPRYRISSLANLGSVAPVIGAAVYEV